MLPGMSDDSGLGLAPVREPRRWVVPVAIGVAGVLVGGGVVWGLSGGGRSAAVVSPAPSASARSSFSMSGTMTLGDFGLTKDWHCTGRGGYSDIGEGASVTVYDGGGQVVATGNLRQGAITAGKCQFPVWVSDVPDGPKFYQVEVSHRGKITLSAEDAKAGRFAASLG